MKRNNQNLLSSLSTYELLCLIVDNFDRDALNHLMQFRRIIYHDGIWIRIPEYILNLCQKRILYDPNRVRYEDDEEFKLRVNDLTRARFLEFAKEGSRGEGCITQYAYILDQIKNADFPENCIRMDKEIAGKIKNSIFYHFNKCVKEAERHITQFQTRYEWQREGKTIMLLYRPTTIDVRHITRWLNESFPDIDPSDPNIKDTVQEALDKYFGSGFFTSLDEEYDNGYPIFEPPVDPDEYNDSPEYHEIIRRIVQRKDIEFDELRPGIQNLGRDRMKELVAQILEGIAEGTFEQNKTANKFGVSKPTMSRFAGSNWDIDKNNVPDLWRNAMRVILTQPEFLEAAAETGLYEVIKKLTESERKDPNR